MKKFIFLFLILLGSNSYAANAWYWGKVISIYTVNSDGSFQVVLDNESIKNFCVYDRVDFKVADMGGERTKAALSMALAAFASGKVWGVVVDLPASEQRCIASPTASQGAGIQ